MVQASRRGPNAQPSNMAVAWGGGVDLSKQVREVGVAPLSTDHFPEASPHKLGSRAREEDVVSILDHATDGTPPTAWAITLEDFNPRGEASTDPLPQEDPDLQRKAGVPNQAKGFRGR